MVFLPCQEFCARNTTQVLDAVYTALQPLAREYQYGPVTHSPGDQEYKANENVLAKATVVVQRLAGPEWDSDVEQNWLMKDLSRTSCTPNGQCHAPQRISPPILPFIYGVTFKPRSRRTRLQRPDPLTTTLSWIHRRCQRQMRIP